MNKKAEALKMIIKQEMTKQKGSELIAGSQRDHWKFGRPI